LVSGEVHTEVASTGSAITLENVMNDGRRRALRLGDRQFGETETVR
jgi:hypothetical protein